MEQIVRTTRQLGSVLRRARRQHHMTQTSLGQKMNVRQATISKLEAGEPGTRLATLMSVLAALDLEIVIRPRTTSSIADLEDIF